MNKRTEPIRSVKGTRDLLPPETALWQRVEQEARSVFGAYGFSEIRTPILEETALFARSVGEDTDIVMKEMYTFEDSPPRKLEALRRVIANRDVDLGNDFSVFQFKRDTEDFIGETKRRMKTGETPASSNNQRAVETLGTLLVDLDGIPTRGMAVSADAKSRLVGCQSAIITALAQIVLSEPLTLRPEATASVVRAYIEHAMFNEGRTHKLYYMGPMFRRERPQKGRYRQFFQIGAEVLGSDHPSIDAEMLEMLVLYLERLGITSPALLINSVGCANCRPEYVKVLRNALQGVKSAMCADCQRRADTNPLRVLDCKVEADQPIIEKLPRIVDHLDPECRAHFDSVTADLKQRGVSYTITPRLVRGLDYYTRTTFEITSDVLGAQNALLGGGRYDGLSELIGGPPTPGFGVAIGEDRLILAVQAANAPQFATVGQTLDAYVAWMGEAALAPASTLAQTLRKNGLRVEIGYESVKLKKSLGAASKLGARFAIIIGEGELETGKYQVKDMSAGAQQEVERDQIASYLKEKVQG